MKQLQFYLESIFLTLLALLPVKYVRHALFLLRSELNLTDRLGYHIRPIHYYEPLPDFQKIQKHQFLKERDFVGIDFRLCEQIELFERLGKLYFTELVDLVQERVEGHFDFNNTYFANLDACLYYSLIRDLKPRRIIEIGSGYSTRIAMKAVEKNAKEGVFGAMTCIEPYPEPRLTEIQNDITLIKKPVEELNFDGFDKLDQNDILFIDSSHVAKFDGDVCRVFLDIIPRLHAGVWIHVHDIFFPHNYPSKWVLEKRIAFNEQYLLETFLSFNSKFTVCAGNYWIWLKHKDSVRTLCPQAVLPVNQMGCSSFWMRRTNR